MPPCRSAMATTNTGPNSRKAAQYRKHYRRPVGTDERQLILDGPALAEGLEYFSLGAMSVSEDGRYLAYSTDTSGGEFYTGFVKDLTTGELLPDRIANLNSGLIWAAGDSMLVYGRANENWRVDRIFAHRVGETGEDREIYHEEQLGFTVSPGLSSNREWLILATGDNETSEVRLLPAARSLCRAAAGARAANRGGI